MPVNTSHLSPPPRSDSSVCRTNKRDEKCCTATQEQMEEHLGGKRKWVLIVGTHVCACVLVFWVSLGTARYKWGRQP